MVLFQNNRTTRKNPHISHFVVKKSGDTAAEKQCSSARCSCDSEKLVVWCFLGFSVCFFLSLDAKEKKKLINKTEAVLWTDFSYYSRFLNW